MVKNDFKQLHVPDSCGVYYFLNSQKDILYIGKATSLRSRLASYFSNDLNEKRSELIVKMVHEATSIDITITDSVLEALILETNLIRTHKPKYNTRSKDDKSYKHLIITNEEWPRVLVTREKDLTEKFDTKDIKYSFGPFPSSQLFNEALKIVRKLFKFYDTPEPIGKEKSKVAKGRIDFNKQIGLYPSTLSRSEYQQTIRHIKFFFQGKKKQIIKELYRDMLSHAKNEEFEIAHIIKKRIFALEHIQDIALIKAEKNIQDDSYSYRIEAYDIAHIAGKSMVGVMTVVQDGYANKSEYKKFKIRTQSTINDTACLYEILERRLRHNEWKYPDIIVVDGGKAQKNTAEKILKSYNLKIPVVSVVKNKQHKPERLEGKTGLLATYKEYILLANAEAHRFAVTYHRHVETKRFIS